MRSIISYFIKNPLIVNVITVFVLLSGFVMYMSMQKEGYPPVEEPGCTISAWSPGASPEDMEINVAMKIEDAIKDVEGIKDYMSQSRENSCYLNVFFEDGYNFEDIRDDMRRKIDSISDFPEDMEQKPVIHEWSTTSMDLLRIGFYSRGSDYGEFKKHYKELKRRIEAIPAISKVESHGERSREIQIRVDYKKLNANYITLDQVVSAIAAHNVQVSGGTLESSTSEKNIVTVSKFIKPLDVKNVILRSNMAGNNVTIADVAEVEDTFSDIQWKIRFNGKDGIYMMVYKKENSDIVETVDEVKKVLEQYKKEYTSAPVGVEILIDQSEATKSRLGIVKNNAIAGLFMVGLLLFVFLNFKNAFWTVLGIPFSIAFGILFIAGGGITINSVSLLAMIIVLGMIVDDAIVISENIHRHIIIHGHSIKTVTNATIEVGHAVLTTILTTLIAFIPLYFMKGVVGSYVKEVPIVISLLLIGSLIESLFILPTHISHILGKFQKSFLGAFFGIVLGYFIGRVFELNIWMSLGICIAGGVTFTLIFYKFYIDKDRVEERSYVVKMRKVYHRFLRILLRFRYLVLIMLLALIVLAGITAKSMKFEMFPSVEANRLEISGNIKDIRSLEYTEKVISEIEKDINKQYKEKGLKSLVSVVGGGGSPEHFELHFLLTPESERDLKTDEIIKYLRTVFTENKFDKMKYEKSDGGPQLGNNVRIEISGNNDEYRNEVMDFVMAELKKIDGVQEINRTDSDTKQEIKIIPKYKAIAGYGVTSEQIARLTRIAFAGYTVTHLQTPEEEIPYKLFLKEDQRKKIESLKNLTVYTSKPSIEPMGEMIDIVEGEALTKIKRYNSERTTTIYADFDSSKVPGAELYKIMTEKTKDIPAKYPGIHMNLGGAAEVSNEALDSLKSTLVVAIAAIFVLLILLFRSISQPMIVIVAIPFGLMGVIFAFFFHGMPLSFMGIMGTIGLSGVVVNDSLIMVEYINQLREKYKKKKKMPLIDMVIEGAETRLRPIILTTATTFVGLLPTAYGLGGKDPLILPAAIALSWGLFFSTTMVLLFLPGFYMIENDVRRLVAWISRGVAK